MRAETDDITTASQKACGIALQAAGGPNSDAVTILIMALKYTTEFMAASGNHTSHDDARNKIIQIWDDFHNINLLKRGVQ